MNQIKKDLKDLKSKNLFREFRTIKSSPGSIVKFKNKDFIMLASNNYFGLNTNPKIISAVKKAIEKYGTGNTGSRLVINFDIHNELENEIAKYKKCENALIYTSGYAANLGVLSCIMGENDLILSDELNHVSIIDGCRLSKADIITYKHCNIGDLENKIKNSSKYKNILVVTDSIFSMDGNLAPLNEIIKLKKKYKFIFMVDNAHAEGIIDTNSKQIDINMGTLSKAIPSQGGYIAGSKDLIDFLKNKSKPFMYSTGLSPADTAAALESLKIINKDKKLGANLLKNADYLRNKLKALGFNTGKSKLQIIPVIIGSSSLTMKFQKLLEKENIFVTGIRPPTVPEKSARLRVSVMATHTKKQLDATIRTFKKIGISLGLIPHAQK